MKSRQPVRPSQARHGSVMELGEYISTSAPARGRSGHPPSQPADLGDALERFSGHSSEDQTKDPAIVIAKRSGKAGRFIRRTGSLALTAAVVSTGAYFGEKLLAPGISYATSSAIPTSERVDPAHYTHVTIPQSGAFDLAERVDPSHDPRNGVEDFSEQLGHTPNPGDTVAVPKPKK